MRFSSEKKRQQDIGLGAARAVSRELDERIAEQSVEYDFGVARGRVRRDASLKL